MQHEAVSIVKDVRSRLLSVVKHCRGGLVAP